VLAFLLKRDYSDFGFRISVTGFRSINRYSICPYLVIVPVELIDFIFEQACTADNLTQIDTIIQSRRAIRLVLKQYRSFTSILITTATPLHAINYILRKPAELPDPILADFILSTLMHCNTSSLQCFTFRFFAKHYENFKPAPLPIFAFSQHPLYGHTSTPSQIHQPRPCPMDWRELGVILTHSPDLQVLILDTVEIYTPASYLDWPCEIPGLTMLDLVFQGKEPMAKFISQMQLPALTTLKITLADNDDVQHLMRCGKMLRDLQRAGPCFFSAFLEASAMGNPCTGINWNAYLQYLVAIRKVSAYNNLNCLWLVTDAIFENRNTRFQFFNEAKPDFLKVAE
ncbi:hypothetical protein C8J57DRAFT_1331110, partial [Mycena rebaudengoi]